MNFSRKYKKYETKTSNDVMRIFKELLKHRARKTLTINGQYEQVFPIDEVQAFLTSHPEIGPRIREFELRGFMKDNSVRLLELIVSNFPNLTRFIFRPLQTVQDHLPKFARLTKLEKVELNLFQPDLEQLTSMPNIAPFTKILNLRLNCSYDDFNVLARFYRPLFPNIEALFIGCNDERVHGQALAEVKAVFPKLTKLALSVPKISPEEFINKDPKEWCVVRKYEYKDQRWDHIISY